MLRILLAFCWILTAAESPLAPVKTDSARDTMRSFMAAMDRHVSELQTGKAGDGWLDDAVRCLDLSQAPLVSRQATGREAAMYLKECIDRVIRIDYDRIPADAAAERWRLKDTEITIWRIADGERRGEHLFTPDTVARAKEMFFKVRHLPLLEGAIGGGFVRPWQEELIPPSLRSEVFGVAYWQWILMTALVFVGLVLRQLARLGAYVLKRLTARTAATWDDELVDALTGPVTHLATTGVWFASLHLIGVTGTAYTVISFLIKGAFFINLAYLAYKLAGFLGNVLEQRMRERHQDLNQGLLRLLRQTLKIIALLFCLLLGAQNMGMDVASLIAGLGIGGLAFALAAKDTLANFFGSVMIMVDRPFRVGDWVIAKGAEGVVEEIGFRSTRLRTFADAIVSIPNSELVLANIENMGQRRHRRVLATLGLEYGTPPERIEAFCSAIMAILRASPVVKQDNPFVCFQAFGASSLDIQLRYFLDVPTFDAEIAERQRIWLEVLRAAERVGVSFAFPTQTLHIATGTPAAAQLKPA
jgi:MscS family membrane protein